MSRNARLRPLASLASVASLAALLALGACVPQLRPVPGSDMVRRSSRRPNVTTGHDARNCSGGRVPTVVSGGGEATLGDPGGVCAQLSADTVPDPNGDHTQPPRRTP